MTTPTTKLEAVNTMLSTIGEAPVNNLTSGLLDAETAETILNNVSRSVQAYGWNFNSEPDYSIAKNTDGHVVLPSNVLRADLAQSETKFRSSKNEYVQRGDKMYDKINHTYNIGKTLKLDLVFLLDYELIPEVARRYIAIKAARIFQERVVGSRELSAMNRNDEQEALIALKEAEGDNGDYNIFDDNSTYSVLDRNIGTRVI
ncbi:MAG: putative tail tubular protein [Prokaryotic dsDNA virus sp.]|jgi:hypothetical protein|nr:MAG: putative tail tubular protein [Prokaryotic dsDNA virus sp.]|tara:strand:- start:6914 stop:7519 length:606 start_codon:yes stop_codon:yes gene_type:complete